MRPDLGNFCYIFVTRGAELYIFVVCIIIESIELTALHSIDELCSF